MSSEADKLKLKQIAKITENIIDKRFLFDNDISYPLNFILSVLHPTTGLLYCFKSKIAGNQGHNPFEDTTHQYWDYVRTEQQTLKTCSLSNVDAANKTFRLTSQDAYTQYVINNINENNIFRYVFDINISNFRILSTEQDPNGTCWKVIFNDNFSCNVFFNYTKKYKTNNYTALGINLTGCFNRPKRFFYSNYGSYVGLFLQDTFRNKTLILHRHQTIAMGNNTAEIETNIYSNGVADVDVIIRAGGGSFGNDNIGTLTFTVPFVDNNYSVIFGSGRSTETGASQSFPQSTNRIATSCGIICNYSGYVNYISAKITGEVDLDVV